MNGIRSAGLALFVPAGLLACGVRADDRKPAPEQPANPVVVALIDKLADVAAPDAGYSPYVSGSSFAPLSGSDRIDVALISPAKPSARSEVFRDLVALGAAAVPDLLRHLDDARPTRLTVRHTFGGMGGFSINVKDKADKPKTYTLKVGDLCYVALGQIVNRPYAAVRYHPTAFIGVHTPTRAPEEREQLKREWGGITPDAHRDSLLKDCEVKGKVDTLIGAFARLGYYYPDALEAPALKFLARPKYSHGASHHFVHDKLYKAADARQRKELFDAYVKEFGEAGRDGVREALFYDLDWLEAGEEQRASPPKDYGQEPRQLLAELFGAPKGVRSRDKPVPETVSADHVGEIIE